MGVHKLIDSPDLLWSLFIDYKKWADGNPLKIEDYVGKEAERVLREKPRALTMEGFENYVANIPKMPWSLDSYFANREGRYEDFVSVCSRIRREIRTNQIEGGLAGIYNPSITQRLNGLVEKTESKVEATVSQVDYSKLSDAALEEIANAGTSKGESGAV